jgi:hypothetical protein
MLGDAAYDSAELREQLDEHGTKPAFPIVAIGNSRSLSTSASTSCAGVSRLRSID